MKEKYIINGEIKDSSFSLTIKKKKIKTVFQKIFPCLFKSEK
jgi:hypothetical protein